MENTRKIWSKVAFIGGLLMLSTGAHAFDFVSVATPAILYDAPSLKAKKLFVVSRYLPLEQIVTLDNWVKVRDSSGQLYWIEKRALSSKRFVSVSVAYAAVREKPEPGATVVFQAPQNLALERLETVDGWVKVRHLDGTVGHVKVSEVWGD